MAALDAVKPSTTREGDYDEGVNDEPYIKRRLYSSEVIGMWNLLKMFFELGTREKCIAFAEEHGLVLTHKKCRFHRKPMNIQLYVNNNVGAFSCDRGNCKNKSKIFRSKGTWFENIKIDMPHVFYLVYCYAHNWKYEHVVFEDYARKDKCLSSSTICDWYNYCRETVVIYTLDRQEYVGKIGGPGKIVEINETKFDKRKYHKGRRVEGHWVIGMIEINSTDLRLEVCVDDCRSAEALLPLIKKHVNVGSVIHTDCWKVDDSLSMHGYEHKRVNHSVTDNPSIASDGTHTQRILAQWRVVTKFYNIKNHSKRHNFADLVVEYVWRRNIFRNKKDPFFEMIAAIKYLYGVNQ